MSLRPVDMQIATLRALDHPDAKMNVLHRADLAHDSSNAALEKSEIRKRSSVNELEKSSQSKLIKEEDHNRGSKGQYFARQGEKKEKQIVVDEKGEVVEFAHIDIKI